MFYERLVEETLAHKDKLVDVSRGLADEKSVSVLRRLIGFRLSLDPELLRPVVEASPFLAPEVTGLSDDDVFTDGGASSPTPKEAESCLGTNYAAFSKPGRQATSM